uniref:VAN3-binding protein-like auxin canalisation domain-containing protein n=1 Tax=Oryza glaberrima TaxID=4538 RepID=I1QW41_ORYGL
MEHLKKGVEFGVASLQRCHSLSCQMAESTQIDERKAGNRCSKEKSRRPKCCHPAEMPVIPKQAMEFLSRTWSPSSSDLFQILSPSSLGTSPVNRQEDEVIGDEDVEAHGDTVRFDGGRSQVFNQTWGILASGKSSSGQHKHKNQPTWVRAYVAQGDVTTLRARSIV